MRQPTKYLFTFKCGTDCVGGTYREGGPNLDFLCAAPFVGIVVNAVLNIANYTFNIFVSGTVIPVHSNALFSDGKFVFKCPVPPVKGNIFQQYFLRFADFYSCFF